jgi:hypothetical protein
MFSNPQVVQSAHRNNTNPHAPSFWHVILVYEPYIRISGVLPPEA